MRRAALRAEDLLFLAMARAALGEHQQARRILEEARPLVGASTERLGFLREAEAHVAAAEGEQRDR